MATSPRSIRTISSIVGVWITWQDEDSFAIEDQDASKGDEKGVRLGKARIALSLTTEECAEYGARSSLKHVSHQNLSHPSQIIHRLAVSFKISGFKFPQHNVRAAKTLRFNWISRTHLLSTYPSKRLSASSVLSHSFIHLRFRSQLSD